MDVYGKAVGSLRFQIRVEILLIVLIENQKKSKTQ